MAEDISQKFLFEQVLLLADEVLKIKSAIRDMQIKISKNIYNSNTKLDTENVNVASNIRSFMMSREMMTNNNDKNYIQNKYKL
tara:strand:- start:58 stop:306 length:249 start_codon:yes stop_codon:yes gene_type:complete